MAGVIPGVVLVTEFATGAETFSRYLDYIDREEAKEQSAGGYLDYMSNEEKTESLFTAYSDEVSKEQKETLKKTFDIAQKNESLMWKTVLTFDNEFLAENGLYDIETKKLDNKKIMQYTRMCMERMLGSEKMSDTATWTGAIHYNTDNIHVHIATVEIVPTRPLIERTYINLSKEFLKSHKISVETPPSRYAVFSDKTNEEIKKLYNDCKRALKGIKLSNTLYIESDGSVRIALKETPLKPPPGTTIKSKLEPKGKFKQSSIDKGKSAVVNEIIASKDVNNTINNVIRKNIIEVKRGHDMFKDKELRTKFLDLHRLMPANKRRMWQYNMNGISHLKPQIDELSRLYIEKYHKEDFKQLTELLDKQEKAYTRAYGEGSENNLKENKLQDLYTRLGNTILTELRQFDKEIHSTSQNKPKQAQKQAHSSPSAVNDSIKRLKRYLNNDFEHVKNQLAYKELEREIEAEEIEI